MTLLVLLFLLYAVALSVALAVAGLRSGAPSSDRVSDGSAASDTGSASSTEAASSESASGRPMRVLIVGATGGTGRQLVAQGLDLGYQVTAFVRDPSKLDVEHPRLRVAQGDVLDPASVETAVREQDAVLSAIGHKRYFGPSRILSEGTRNLLHAMEAHGVHRFVCETSLGIGGSAGRMGLYYTFLVIPLVVPFYFWDKTRQERAIAGSRVEWIIVRPGALTNGEKRGRVRHGPGVGSYVWTLRISRADVAEFMLRQLTSDEYLSDAVSVTW
ncbi:MAG: NAD(P)-dependent oxidoreductase [Gemmatimonadota bacterium]